MSESELRQLARYLGIENQLGKLSYTDDNIIQMETKAGNVKGFSSIVNHFHQIVEKENTTSESYFLKKQFFDFANLFIRTTCKRDKCEFFVIWGSKNPANKFSFYFLVAACLELNGYLETRSYLVGQSMSISDFVVFLCIADVYKQLSPNDKENYLNLSRWFDHLQTFIQQNVAVKQRDLVNLATIHLAMNSTKVQH